MSVCTQQLVPFPSKSRETYCVYGMCSYGTCPDPSAVVIKFIDTSRILLMECVWTRRHQTPPWKGVASKTRRLSSHLSDQIDTGSYAFIRKYVSIVSKVDVV